MLYYARTAQCMTMTSTSGVLSSCAQAHKPREVVHLLGHKPFIYLQVSAAESAE